MEFFCWNGNGKSVELTKWYLTHLRQCFAVFHFNRIGGCADTQHFCLWFGNNFAVVATLAINWTLAEFLEFFGVCF